MAKHSEEETVSEPAAAYDQVAEILKNDPPQTPPREESYGQDPDITGDLVTEEAEASSETE